MGLHPQFPTSPYEPLVPSQRWFPADETLRATAYHKLLPPLVAKIREGVHVWRHAGYAGASATSVSLLRWWFETEHQLEEADGSLSPFRYYFAQREAVESVIWLYDVRRARDKFDLLRFDASGAVSPGMFDEDWPRYVLKMATGAGKTKVLSLLLAWSFFHKLYEADSALSRNFLVIAPNIIVLDRLRADFDGLRIFFNDPVLPVNGRDGRNWRDDFQVTLHIQDEVRAVRETGNIFLTNIHRVFLGDVSDPSLEDDDLRDYFLDPFGAKPVGRTTDSKTDLGEIVREVDELAVFNDEAHHIHDPRMAWFKSIQDIHHRMLQKDRRLTLQVDLTATPRHDNGAIFVQTVSDYPLVEAIHQDVVKHPILPDAASRAKLQEATSALFTEKYADYLQLGIEEWRKSYAEHERLGKKAVLFVMVDDTRNCDDVGAYLEKTCPELQSAVLVIHTKNNGEISEAASGKSKEELEKLRKQSNEIDSWSSPYKAIVSVLVLKEGWDVRNVTTIVGLRPYASKSNILQRERKAVDETFRAFEVLNLGRYERQVYLNVSGRLTGKKKEQALARREQEFRDLILKAYRAEPLPDSGFFHGKFGPRLVVVGPINLPVGRLFVEEVVTECRKRGATRVDVLAFEFEMGLFPAVLDEAKQKGIDLTPKTIPPEVFDKRAVERGQVRFHDVAYIEVTPRFDGKNPLAVAVELTDFSVFYSQGLADAIAAELKEGKSEVVCDAGQLVKVTKDKHGVITRDVLTKHWTDWVDYWAVDFNYESRKEIIKVPKGSGIHTVQGHLPGQEPTQRELELPATEFEERWTGAYIFENEWQSFRTRQKRDLEMTSAPHTYAAPGRYVIAVKVIDIFGNDTMTLVPITVG